jgi:esterase/lipase superfamily enzyme
MNDVVKTTSRWYSERVRGEITVVRWGTFGRPVLIFPSAGGDAEEIERAMMTKDGSADYRMWLLNQFHECIRWEVVPAIHADLGGQAMDVIVTGASIGAFNAVAVLCRYPDVFSAAIGMSGSYRIERFYDEAWSQDLYVSAPLQFLPGLDGPQLDTLRGRFAVLASGEGDWENIGESWRMAEVLGAKGIPNRVDNWGPQWPHEWPTWHRMLPQYLRELT